MLKSCMTVIELAQQAIIAGYIGLLCEPRVVVPSPSNRT